MARIVNVIRRLWLFGSCDHRNTLREIQFNDTTSLCWCKRCGRIIRGVLAEQDWAKPLSDPLDRGIENKQEYRKHLT